MTREEALEILKNSTMKDTLSDQWQEAYKMAIQALEQEPSGDLISRQAVMDLISNFILEIHTEGGRDLNAQTNNVLRQILRNVGSDRVLPSVNLQEPKYCDRNICIKNEYNGIGCDECEVTKSQEPKTGHWIEHDWEDMREKGYYRCSVCGTGYQRFVKGIRKSDVPYIDGQEYTLQNIDNYCPNCGARMIEPQESEDKE